MANCPPRDRLNAYVNRDLAIADRSDVESHLVECADCQQTMNSLQRMLDVTLDRPPAGEHSQASAATLEHSSTLASPTRVTSPDKLAPLNVTIPGYELLEELGRGGMGVVYQARQISLNRMVALKMIRSTSLADAQQLARFYMEAETLAQLQHPNIVQIFETGQHQDIPFLSMEYVPGGTLSHTMNARRLTVREAAALVEKLARAMFSAHERGVLHRDLKPANVLMASNGEPKITDFGLAKRVGSESQLTVDHTVMGTPSYMPPEQALGQIAAIEPRSDVYSLGAILYELLTGRPPFRGSTPMETIQQVIQREPAAPRTLNPRIPRDLETICVKCLQKQPSSRYETAADLADDLRRFQLDEPILARRIGMAGRAWRWCRRNPALSATIALTCVAVLAGIGGVAWQFRQAERARRLADQQYQRFTAESAEKFGLIQDLLERVPEDQRAQDHRLQAAVASYESWLAEEPSDPSAQASYAEALFRVAEIRRRTGQYDRAEEIYLKARNRYEQLSATNAADPIHRQKLVETLTWLGENYREGGKLQQAIDAYGQALTNQEELGKRSAPDSFRHADTARALYSRALALRDLNRNDEAETDLRQSIELLDLALRDRPQEAAMRQGLARSHINLGMLLRATARPKDAHREYLAAIGLLTLLEDQHPENAEYHLESAMALMNRANLLFANHPRNDLGIENGLGEAEASYRTSIDKLRSLASQYTNVPRYRKELANSLNGLGAVLSQNRQANLSEQAWKDAVEEIKKLVARSPDVAEYHALQAQTTHNLAYLKRDNADGNELVSLLREATDAQSRAISLNPTNVLYARSLRTYQRNLSRALVEQGQHVEAAAVAEQLAANAADDAQFLYAAAKVFAQCATAARQDSSLDPSRQTELAEHHERNTAELLKTCRQNGVTIKPEDFPGIAEGVLGK